MVCHVYQSRDSHNLTAEKFEDKVLLCTCLNQEILFNFLSSVNQHTQTQLLKKQVLIYKSRSLALAFPP